MEHEEYKELLALEAMGALNDEESRRLAAHLESCAECRAELESLRATASELAYTVAPVRPPVNLRARILSSVNTTMAEASSVETSRAVERRDARDASSAASSSSAVSSSSAASSSAASSSKTSLPPFAQYGAWQLVASRPSLTWGALAAALLIASLAVTSLVLWRQNRGMRGELAGLSERFETWRREMANDREAKELLSAPGARIAHLNGTAVAPRARASLVYDERTGRAMLFGSELPPTPEGKAYQLWYIAGGKPLPGGVFTTDFEGRVAMRDKAPAQVREASIFAITLEPAGGVAAPTGDKYLLSPVS